MDQDQINIKDDKGYTPLYYALKKARNSFAEADSLIRSGADINVCIKGKPLLFYFAKPFSMTRLEYLITMGADLGAVDSRGRNLLNILEENNTVSYEEREEIVYIAYEMGIELKSRDLIAAGASNKGKSPVDKCSFYVEKLKSIENLTPEARAVHSLVKKLCSEINRMDIAEPDFFDLLRSLADFRKRPMQAIYTIEAFILFLKPGKALQEDVCRQLAAHFILQLKDYHTENMHTHFFWGVAGIYLFDVEMVRQYCQGIRSVNDSIKTLPISYESKMKYYDLLTQNYRMKPSSESDIQANLSITELLFKKTKSTSTNNLNYEFHNALYECSFHNSDYFLSRGAYIHNKISGPSTKGLEYSFYKKNIDITDFNYLHILFYTKYYGRGIKAKTVIRQIAYLVSKGMDINACDSGRISPLHVAASYKRAGQVDIVRYMLELGADPCIRTGEIGANSNKTAADFAKDPAVEELLRSAEAAFVGAAEAADTAAALRPV